MEETIGTAAGQIWGLLSSRKNAVSVTDLPRLTGLKPQTAYQGLGWLAREGKVVYTEKNGRTLVALTPSEVCC